MGVLSVPTQPCTGRRIPVRKMCANTLFSYSFLSCDNVPRVGGVRNETKSVNPSKRCRASCQITGLTINSFIESLVYCSG